MEFLQMCTGIIAHGQKWVLHPDHEHQRHVFCLPCILPFLSLLASQLISEFWEWVDVIQIGDNQIGFELGGLLILFTGLLPAIHPSKKFTLLWDNSCHGYLTCLEWTKHLSPGDLLKTSWCWMTEKQKFSENPSPFLHLAMIQDRFTRPSFLPLCSACLPSTVPGLLLSGSLAPATFSHFHKIYPSIYSLHLLNHRTSFWRLPTVTLHITVLTDFPPPPVQAADLFVCQ